MPATKNERAGRGKELERVPRMKAATHKKGLQLNSGESERSRAHVLIELLPQPGHTDGTFYAPKQLRCRQLEAAQGSLPPDCLLSRCRCSM